MCKHVHDVHHTFHLQNDRLGNYQSFKEQEIGSQVEYYAANENVNLVLFYSLTYFEINKHILKHPTDIKYYNSY